MTPKLLPTALILGCTALLAFAFIIPSNTPQPAATAYAQSTPSVSFTQEEVQGKEGSTIYLRVKLDTPVTKTTKVTIKLTPDQGTTSRDIPGLTGTKTVTFYKNGTQTKTVAIRTSRTTAEGDKSLTASITKVGNTTVQGDTARVLVKDQKSSAPLANNQNTNTQTQNTTTTPPTNCAQYEGVIPFKGERYQIVDRVFGKMILNPVYGFSAEAQRDLDLMQGDIGLFNFRVGGSHNSRVDIPLNTIFAFKIKTTDYNFPVGHYIGGSSHPGSGEGRILWSVSECRGDFTSSKVMNNQSTYADIYGPCVSLGSQVASGIVFGYEAGTCRLEKNKTYYVNVAVYDLVKNGTGQGLSIDVQDDAQVYKSTQVTNEMWLDVIKNKTAFYNDMRSAQRQLSAEAQRRVQACRSAIGTGVRTGTECSSLPSPASIFSWQ